MRDYQLPGRSPVYAVNGMAATAHPLATGAAVDVLRRGGNAVDAAIAAAGILAVVEPGMSGIGGDCFALLAMAGQPIVGYNGSGTAPAAAEADQLRAQGLTHIAPDSPHSVTIPGAVGAWQAMSSSYGTRGLDELLQPAIRYADTGYLVQPKVAVEWQLGIERLRANVTARDIFLPADRAPRVGDLHRQPKLAKALRLIAAQGAAGFYLGPVAADMVHLLQAAGGCHTLDDFATFTGFWVAPLLSAYREHQLVECAPNGQGFVVANALNILENFAFNELESGDADKLHLQIESLRLAYRGRDQFFDEYFGGGEEKEFLRKLVSTQYAHSQSKIIQRDCAMPLQATERGTTGGDTTCIAIVDSAGNAVSLMNSLFFPFGSGLVSEKYGVLLHNRGCAFSLSGPPARVIAPGRRPAHTILPAMLAQHDEPTMVFGVVGAEYQTGGQVRLISALLDSGLDVQQALDLPRVFFENGTVLAEPGITEVVLQSLLAKGHAVKRTREPLGAGQAIQIDRVHGVLVGGSDFRKDGCVLGF